MFELMLAIGAAVGMSKVAEEDQKPGLMWGAITFGICIAFMFLLHSLPFLRVLLGGVAAFILMAATSKN